MDSNASPPRPVEARMSPVWRVEMRTPDAKPEQSAEQAAAQSAARASEILNDRRVELTPARLTIEIDREAGRFVNTLVDPNSDVVLRRYPSERQLAYSRAVNAYMRALRI